VGEVDGAMEPSIVIKKLSQILNCGKNIMIKIDENKLKIN
jgi:hypothetical protein